MVPDICLVPTTQKVDIVQTDTFKNIACVTYLLWLPWLFWDAVFRCLVITCLETLASIDGIFLQC